MIGTIWRYLWHIAYDMLILNWFDVTEMGLGALDKHRHVIVILIFFRTCQQQFCWMQQSKGNAAVPYNDVFLDCLVQAQVSLPCFVEQNNALTQFDIKSFKNKPICNERNAFPD